MRVNFRRAVVVSLCLLVLALPVAAQEGNPWSDWLKPVSDQIGVYLGYAIAATLAVVAAPIALRITISTGAAVARAIQRAFGS